MKLIKKIKYTGELTLMTGLHVGGTNTSLGIGGVDSAIVRNPIDNLPYIPGSTIKGKMRSLLEMKFGYTVDGKPTDDPNNEVGCLFGTTNGSKGGSRSRIIVRDAFLNTEKSPSFENADLYYAESKTENAIDRIKVRSNPRTIERVPAGAVFDINFILDVYEGDNEEELKKTIDLGIRLIEEDYLGCNGSRGYGQVKINWIEGTPTEVKL